MIVMFRYNSNDFRQVTDNYEISYLYYSILNMHDNTILSCIIESQNNDYICIHTYTNKTSDWFNIGDSFSFIYS